jgi:hypothetical protein
MVKAVRAKAATAGAWNLRPVVSSAETLAPSLRLRAGRNRQRSTGWTGIWPLAGSSAGSSQVATWRCAGLPCPGPVSKADSGALAAALDRWKAALGADQRIPGGWEEARSRRPDSEVLSDAGSEHVVTLHGEPASAPARSNAPPPATSTATTADPTPPPPSARSASP